MATTSLWHIEGRLKDLIAYVENPEKTVAAILERVEYIGIPKISRLPRRITAVKNEYGTIRKAENCLKILTLLS